MAEYAEREKQFNDSLPAMVGNFMLASSMADGVARMQSVEITRKILELPNITIEQKIDILNRDKPLVYASSLPSVLTAEPRPFLAKSLDLEMSMTVSASTSSESDLDSKTEGSARVSFGFGLFKGTATMKAAVSTHSSKKRSSDYTATTDMKLHMERHPLPEGLAKTIDAMNDVAKATNDINVAVARREVARLADEENLSLPEPTEDQEGSDEAEE